MHPELGEAGQVVGGGEESEVGVDLGSAAHPGAATAVFRLDPERARRARWDLAVLGDDPLGKALQGGGDIPLA